MKKHVTGIQPDSKRVQLELGSCVLEGEIRIFPGVGAVHYRAAKVKDKAEAYLKLWIEHLAIQLTGKEQQSLLIGEDQVLVFKAVPDAAKILGELIEIYERGLAMPLPFFPKSALTYAAGPGPKTTRSADELARDAWEGNDDDEFGEGEKEDPYFKLCFRNHPEPLGPEFQQLAQQVFKPLLEHAAEEKQP